MGIDELKGLAIFVGIIGAYTFVFLGCLEQRHKKIARVIDDAKYVN